MKKGFTLSEVLITLGIVSVIAALTIPVLISKIQLKIFETEFKKEYSTLQNAINYINTTEELSECYLFLNVSSFNTISNDCENLYQNLIKKLDLKPVDNSVKNQYAKRDDVLAKGGSAIHNGIAYDYYFKFTKSYFLNDGSIIFLPENSSQASRSSIIFDVNGKKGPNKWGYDIFWMNLTRPSNNSKGNTRLTDEYMSIKEKGGRYPREILRGQDGSSDYTPYNW